MPQVNLHQPQLIFRTLILSFMLCSKKWEMGIKLRVIRLDYACPTTKWNQEILCMNHYTQIRFTPSAFL